MKSADRAAPRSAHSWPRRLFGLLVVAFALFVAGWEVLRFTPFNRVWFFELTDIFGLLFYVPLPLLLVLAALTRARGLLLWLLLPVACFLHQYGPQLLPKQPSATGTPLKVMTSNLLFSNGHTEGFAAVLAREQPDVVAVQELGSRMGDPLAALLKERYPYQLVYPARGAEGMGLFSRLPFETQEPRSNPGPGPCYCLVAQVRVGGQLVTVANMHPEAPEVDHKGIGIIPWPRAFDSREQDPGRPELLERARDATGPLLVLGDLNTGDRQPYYRELRRYLGDAFVEGGWGFGLTFPADRRYPPLIRIDYVLHNAAWKTVEAHTGSLDDSDHRYLVATLALAN